MGWNFAPVYGELDLGSAIELAEQKLQEIKSNKFDKNDLEKLKGELEKIVSAIDTAIAKYEQEN